MEVRKLAQQLRQVQLNDPNNHKKYKPPKGNSPKGSRAKAQSKKGQESKVRKAQFKNSIQELNSRSEAKQAKAIKLKAKAKSFVLGNLG